MILEPGKQRQENLKFKVSLDHVVSSTLAWDTQYPPAQERVVQDGDVWGREENARMWFFLTAMFIIKYSGCLFHLYG